MKETRSAFRLKPVTFEELPGWDMDDPSPLWEAMADCRNYLQSVKAYKPGHLGLTAEDLLPLLVAGSSFSPQSAFEARAFLERETLPFRIALEADETGLVTAFYEPEVAVSDSRNAEYRYPFYRRPLDLVVSMIATGPITSIRPMSSPYRLRRGFTPTRTVRRLIKAGSREGGLKLPGRGQRSMFSLLMCKAPRVSDIRMAGFAASPMQQKRVTHFQGSAAY